MTSISEYHLHLEKQLTQFFSDIKSNRGETVLKTYNFTMTFLFRDDKGEWKKHVLTTENSRNIYCGIQLPKAEKKLHAFLLQELPKLKESHDPRFGNFFDMLLHEFESCRPGSEKASFLVKSFKISNEKTNNQDWSVLALEDCRDLIYPKFNSFGAECMIEKMDINLVLLQKDDFSKSQKRTFSATLTQKCKTCGGFRTTAHKLNECHGCLKDIPSCNAELFSWKAH